MPPEDTLTGNVYFSAGGEYKPLARIAEIPTIEMEVVTPKDTPYSIIEDMVIEGSFIMAWPLSMREKLHILTGKYPSNNWLKMHGCPMERKLHKRRRLRDSNGRNFQRIHQN